jgi:molecular chaperone DnaJ
VPSKPVSKRDYYEVLGISRDADEQQLKTAYRRLAMEHHPDRNPNDKQAEERFKEAAEAYSVLCDPQKRAAYDRFGRQAVQGAGGGFDPSSVDFGDILGEFFGLGDLFGGGGRRRNGPHRGEDLRYDLEIEFEDAVFGKTVDIQAPRLEACKHCKGKGAEPGTGTTTCPTCRGRGEVLYQQSFLSIRRTCGQCNGAGEIIKKRCTVCHGEGYSQVNRKLKVTIPPGVDGGTRLRLSNEGQPGPNGGPNGDLYVVLKVRDHPIFDRNGNDLHCRIPINVAQAALGAEVQAPTLEGPDTIRIPEGTQTGAQFRIRGKGVPHVNGHGRGDLFIHIDVKVPAKLNRAQRDLFEQLREALPVDNEPAEKGIFEKVKDYFM